MRCPGLLRIQDDRYVHLERRPLYVRSGLHDVDFVCLHECELVVLYGGELDRVLL